MADAIINLSNPKDQLTGILQVIFNNTYEHGRTTILEVHEANARQYEVLLQNSEVDQPEWYYINMYENTICRIDVETRERGPLFEIK